MVQTWSGLVWVTLSTRRFVLCLTLCPFSIAITSLGETELILVLFVRLFDLCLFGFVGFLFLLVSGKGCSLWLWHSLDFSLTFFLQDAYERLQKKDAVTQEYNK